MGNASRQQRRRGTEGQSQQTLIDAVLVLARIDLTSHIPTPMLLLNRIHLDIP